MIMIWLVSTIMVGDVHSSVDLSVAENLVYIQNKNTHQFKNIPKTYLMNIPCMYIL